MYVVIAQRRDTAKYNVVKRKFAITRRDEYEKLTSKPPLQAVSRQGTGVNGSKFKFDGMAYMNISFITEKGLPFIVEYEPILISKEVTCNIFGAKTENRFASYQRDIKNTKIAYVTDNLETINVECYRESPSSGCAFIEVAKCKFLQTEQMEIIKTRVVGSIKKKENQLFQIRNCNESIQSTDYCTEKTTKRHIVLNNTEETIKLRKGDRIATVDLVTKVPAQEKNTISVFSHEVSNESPELKHLNTSEQRKLHEDVIKKGYKCNQLISLKFRTNMK